jgi:serine/threonine protein kinase
MAVMDVRERTLAGRYRLEEVIGRGGMSTVYRATDGVLDRDVAVKVLLPVLAEQDPTYAARFEREARAAAALASSAVVTVFDTGIDEDGSQFIVMEYVAGRSLAQLLADERPLETAEATRIAGRVADALHAAHAAGILHRDIKPANVMLADDGTVKLLDFGIARRVDGTTLTQVASVVGTAAYMAPERALGRPGDARADIYSLGCLLYAMLTGRAPFTGEHAAAVLHQHVNVEPVAPSRLRRGIPAGLDALVLAMLAKAPEARPPTAAEISERLAALSGTQAGAAAATVPLGTAATRRLPRRRSRAPATGLLLRDHRWRALAMGLATALVALLALALIAGGGSSPRKPAVTHRARAKTTITHVAPTQPAPTQPAPTQTPPPPAAKPKAPKPGGPTQPKHGPPGHHGHHRPGH